MGSIAQKGVCTYDCWWIWNYQMVKRSTDLQFKMSYWICYNQDYLQTLHKHTDKPHRIHANLLGLKRHREAWAHYGDLHESIVIIFKPLIHVCKIPNNEKCVRIKATSCSVTTARLKLHYHVITGLLQTTIYKLVISNNYKRHEMCISKDRTWKLILKATNKKS